MATQGQHEGDLHDDDSSNYTHCTNANTVADIEPQQQSENSRGK